MSLFRTRTTAIRGIDARLTDVGADIYRGGANRDFIAAGMPGAASHEKRVAGFDLPMAIGVLGAMGVAPESGQFRVTGECSLDRSLRPVPGALSMAACARKQGIASVIASRENAAEAGVVETVRGYRLAHLGDAVQSIKVSNDLATAGSTREKRARLSPRRRRSATFAAKPSPSARSKWRPPAPGVSA